MGKEQQGAKRERRRVTGWSSGRTSGVAEEAGKAWTNVASLNDISEQGNVLVIVRVLTKETALWCSGVANEGNSFCSLLLMLKSGGFIPEEVHDFCFYRCVDFLWLPVEPVYDLYNSGDSILLLIEESPVTPAKTKVKARANTRARARARPSAKAKANINSRTRAKKVINKQRHK